MARGKRRENRRRGDESSDDEIEAEAAVSTKGGKAENFRDRRELQRKQAAEKRRLKQRCFTCGKTGHVQRSCPGVEDDGRGESKYTKSKGDAGALKFKPAGKNGKKKQNGATSTIPVLDLPSGFEPMSTVVDDHTDESKEPFVYYDAMCDGAATLQYLRTGRSGAIFQKTKDEALDEFHRVLNNSRETSNFGGCIAQVFLKRDHSWSSDTILPLPWLEPEGESHTLPCSFVIGLGHNYDCVHDVESARFALLGACDDPRVVGLCAKLNYSDFGKLAMDREAQLARVCCTCAIAAQAKLPVQLQLMSGVTVRASKIEDESNSLYSMELHDLQVILETPENAALKVHLTSWMGMAIDMLSLLQQFPDTLWVGMNGSVSFSKAAQAHECAFEIPLNRLLLETGSNIPAPVASALGRQAFPHSGLIPHVAVAIAEHKKYVSPDEVARQASLNTIQLYQKIKVSSNAVESKPSSISDCN